MMEEANCVGVRCLIDYGRDMDEEQCDDAKGGPQLEPNLSIELTFDTETRTKPSQNMTFGACTVHVLGKLKELILFYNPDELTSQEMNTVKTHGAELGATVMTRTEFVEKVFFHYVLDLRAVCVGINLPFDLRSLGISFKKPRNRSKNPNKAKLRLSKQYGISIKLTEDTWRPRIRIVNRNSMGAFIKFTRVTSGDKNPDYVYYQGCFVDIRTFIFALTDKGCSLQSAAKYFKCDYTKTPANEYGVVTPEHIDYCINDVLCTHNVFQQAKERYEMYGLTTRYDKLVSPASVGKAYLAKLGIKSFHEKNPDFPKDIEGFVMQAYYGGRSEVHIRKTPVDIAYLDFTSMYPTMHRLHHLDDFLKAETIEHHDSTEETRNLLNNISINDIQNPDNWAKVTVCLAKMDGDIVPVRAKYNAMTMNICINEVTSDSPRWYTLQDLIGSKFLAKKTPIIERAITFTPDGRQDGLNTVEILPGVTVTPDDDFIKLLIEERQRTKKLMKTKTGEEKEQLDILQNAEKIIANATSYGIYIELNPKDTEKQTVTVYGSRTFQARVDRIEEEGVAFNPIIATAITGGARLMLATVQALLEDNDGYIAGCDTDGVFISPQHTKLIQDFFQPLNPYNDKGIYVFKIEDDDKKPVSKSGDYEDDDEEDEEQKNEPKHPARLITNSKFYGISAKRYVIYDYDENTDNIDIRKYSLHGLGHLVGIDKKQVWIDIINLHYHPEQWEETLTKYDGRVAVSRLRISSFHVLDRFKNYNKRMRANDHVKPFNFMTVGIGNEKDPKTDEYVIPLRPYTPRKSKEFKNIQHESFTDLLTGKEYNNKKVITSKYWKPLRKIIESYLNHPEAKLEGDIGQLRRRHLHISDNAIRFIGKETNELSEAEKNSLGPEDTLEIIDIEALIPSLKPDDADKIGITRRSLYNHQKALQMGEHLTLKDGVRAKYTRYFNKLLL